MLMFMLAHLLVFISPFQSSSGDVVVKGRYSNYKYAYSVRIPKGLTGFRPAAPAPNHGFGIALSEQQKSFVWVDGSYNAAFWKSFGEAIQAHIGYISDKAVNPKLVRKERASIAGLPAIGFVIVYKAKDSGEEMVDETILAFRKGSGVVGIVYTLELDAPQSRYKRDREALAAVHNSWQLKSLP
jgi:hypothetical protein